MRHAELPLVILVLAFAVTLRMIALTADPPGWLSWSAGIYSDEGIYSNDARMKVLDAQREPGDFQVAKITPLQNRLLLWVFRRCGASLRIVRMVAVVFSTVGLAAFWLAMRLSYDRSSALAALILLSVSAPFVLYNRLGLLEMPALFWLTLGFAMLASASRIPSLPWRLAALFLSGLCAGICVAWKGTFILGALPLAAYALLRHRLAALATACGAAAALSVYGIQYYLPNRAETMRVGRYYIDRQYLPHSMAGVEHDLLRGLFTGESDGVVPYLLRFAPLLTLFALCALFPKVRARKDVWLWLWAGLPIAALLFLNYTPSRYFLIFWPALAGLAACAIVRLGHRRSVYASALAVCVALNVLVLVEAFQMRTYTLQDDAALLDKTMPHDAWIAGQFAPALCLDTRIRAIYVQPGLANSPPQLLTTLPVTHVLVTRVSSVKDDPWAGQYSHLIAAPAGLFSLPVGRRFTVDLYANKYALP